MTEIWFYHLQRQPLERALPALLEKAVARGWRVVLQSDDADQLETLDALLWTYAKESFMPHARAGAGDPARQIVYLTLGSENPNAAALRLFVGKTEPGAALGSAATSPYQRAIVLFDGNDEDELSHARMQWKTLKDAGFALAYWQQGERGGWEKKM